MQGDDVFQFIGEMGPPCWFATRKGLFRAVVGRRQMVDAGQERAEHLAIRHDAADRNAAEADPVVAPRPADEARARALPAHVEIGERYLEGGIDRL